MADRHCIICVDFITSDQEIMKRHVAIIHGQSTFSTLQCDDCKEIYYDFDHFRDHIRESPTCSSEFHKINPVPLSQDVERAFVSLVDQTMKPVQVQSGPSIGGQSSGTGTLPINRESARSPSENQTSSSVEKPSMDEGNGNSGAQKIISVTSLAHERSFIDQPSTMDIENGVQCENPVETDTQQHVADADFMEHEDGSESVLNREAVKSVWTVQTWTKLGLSTNQVPTADGNGNGGDQEQTSCKPSEDDLRRHCLQMIVKRQHENRLNCLLCRRSIGIFSDGNPQYLAVLDHAASHLPSPIFNCLKCEFKSHASLTMRMHMNDQHSESMDQYVDTTSDRINELMQLVSRCFDYGFKAEPSQVVRLISNSGSSTVPKNMFKTHIAADSEKKTEMPLACAPLPALRRYYLKLPDQHARPIVPEVTFQQPAPNISSTAATAAGSSANKRIILLRIAQPSSKSPVVSGIMTSGGQSAPQTGITPSASLFRPPANVAARSSGTTLASNHVSDRDDDSMSVGRESMPSLSPMIPEEGRGSETAPLHKIVSPTGSSEERRFFCTAFGCKKNYKYMKNIRHHIKMVHNAGTAEPQPNAIKFRCECGKAYKTMQGLGCHMVQADHRKAPIPPSNTISNPCVGNKKAPGGAKSKNAVVIVSASASQFKRVSSISSMDGVTGTQTANSKNAVGMAGVSATAIVSQFNPVLPISMMAGVTSTQTDNVSGPGLKQECRGPQSSLDSAYYTQPPNLKSGSSMTTLPSGLSVQVSNLGDGAQTTVQVGQHGAMDVVGLASSGGPVDPGPAGTQNLHISAGRRLSAAHQMQQHHLNPIGGRPLKILSGIGSSGGNIQGDVVSKPSSPGVNADSSSSSLTSAMDSTEDGNNDLVCTKCGFTTAFKNRLVMHQKILHAE